MTNPRIDSQDTPVRAKSARTDKLKVRLESALDALERAESFARSNYQNEVFQVVEAMMASEAGLRELYAYAPRFDSSGVFHAGPWEDPSKLLPPLVAGSLRGAGVYPIVETLSELRILAIANGDAESEKLSKEDAVEFLRDIMALNLDLMFPGDTEEERILGGPQRESNIRLFSLISESIDMSHLRTDVVEEIEQISAQRPIMVDRLKRMVDMATRIPAPSENDAVSQRLLDFRAAIDGPSPRTADGVSPAAYREILPRLDHDELKSEALAFGQAMTATGLVSRQHAVLARFLRKKDSELLHLALNLNASGKAELDKNATLVNQLITVAVLPSTAQCIYGFARVLERGLLSRDPIATGLQQIIDLDLQADVRQSLLARRDRYDGVTANSILLAGVLSVLGQPLGLGQGHNPTCQAARGLSMWSQHNPSYIVDLLIIAARDGLIEMNFEGQVLRSNLLSGGLARFLDPDLDPVSLVLVPHLDRTYDDMMRRVALRSEDGHKWVNPSLYGRQVPTGFASVFADRAQTTVAAYEDFVRRFYATHHPAYNDGHDLRHPNPVGLLITSSHGAYLGPHAVTLTRVAEDPDGRLRAYFFNPNNEGRQDWGFGVNPSVSKRGEREGESSLPFHQFTSRLYAFHYNPYEEGDSYAVPNETVKEISEAARESWGKAFLWI